jgi:hypothetical protein
MKDNTISRRKFVSTGAIAVSGLAALGLSSFAPSLADKKNIPY